MRDALAKARNPLSGDCPSERVVHLPGRSSGLGAKPGQEDGIRSLSPGPRGARGQDGRSAAGAEGGCDPKGKAYLLHDSHWTPRGAIAGFNAVVEADAHPDWRIDPATALGPPEERKGGDLARLLGVQDDVTETAEPLALPLAGKDETLSQDVMPAHVITTGKPGPTILVIGDSFTASYFPLMLAQHVGRAIWVHYHHKVRLRLDADRQVSPGRGLVGADRARPHLRSRRRPLEFRGAELR